MPDPIQRFIDAVERKYENRSGTVSIEWTWRGEKPISLSIYKFPIFEFRRALREMNEWEIFALKLADLNDLLGEHFDDIGRFDYPLYADAEKIREAVMWGDGRCEQIILSDDGPVTDQSYKFWEILKNGGYTPGSMADGINTVKCSIEYYNKSELTPIKRWIRRYLGRPAAPSEQSKLFSTAGSPYSLLLGKTEDSGKALYYTGEASLITIAPPGKGKTQCHVLPALASYRGPVIALDVKGECFEATAPIRNDFGPVLRFAPTDPENSARYNPLDFVDENPDGLWESSRFLADLLVVVRSQSDPTWESQGKDLLTLIIAYTVSTCEPEQRTIQRVLDLVSTVGLDDMLAGVSSAESPFPSAMQRVAARFRQMGTNSPKQFEGVLSGASQHLHVWEGPKVEKVTASSDWAPEDFRQPPYPTLYLCIPPEALDTYAPILRVLVGQHVRRLMRKHTRSEAPILFLLDELPRLGPMQPIREALETGRSYGIKLWMFAQYPEQVTTAYPGVGDGMIESCDAKLYMNPSMGTAERISKAFGESLNVLSGVRKNVLEATEIMSPEHRDSIFVLASGEENLILKKQFFHENTWQRPALESPRVPEPPPPPPADEVTISPVAVEPPSYESFEAAEPGSPLPPPEPAEIPVAAVEEPKPPTGPAPAIPVAAIPAVEPAVMTASIDAIPEKAPPTPAVQTNLPEPQAIDPGSPKRLRLPLLLAAAAVGVSALLIGIVLLQRGANPPADVSAARDREEIERARAALDQERRLLQEERSTLRAERQQAQRQAERPAGSPGPAVSPVSPPQSVQAAAVPPSPSIARPVDEVTDCDRLAASPTDLDKHPGVPGVSSRELTANARRAVESCERAAAANNNPRIKYQLARAYQVIDPAKSASILYDLINDSNYRAANNAFGELYKNGIGVPRSIQDAAWYFRNGSKQDDPNSMVSLAWLILAGSAQPENDAERPIPLLARASQLGNPYARSVMQTLLPMNRNPEAVPPSEVFKIFDFLLRRQ